ncbi:DUF2635 domain-containing protein [Azorhizophilus paspali]|uniref:DUF2635 domain-containing protein n=1 Tax=Azorhizophilus paspali TaxID=69963 RepID=A0ABV6SMI9_AZOPA
MNDRRTLKPADGRLVRHPADYRPLAAEGEPVELNSYWRRKLKAGDVIEVKPAASAAAKEEGN